MIELYMGKKIPFMIHSKETQPVWVFHFFYKVAESIIKLTMKNNRVPWSLIAAFLFLILPDGTQAELTAPHNNDHALRNKFLYELKDHDPKVREHAAGQLGALADPAAVQPLLAVLQYDDVYRVRKTAAWALGELRDTRAVIPLIRALSHKDWIIRSEAATALGKIGDSMAVAALIDLLQEENDHVIVRAMWALGEIGQERAVIPLIEKLKSEIPDIRSEAATALGKIGDNRAVPHLTALLGRDRNPDVRQSVVWALGEMRNEAAVRSLTNALADDDYSVRVQAQASLEKAGAQAVPFLVGALRHDKQFVRNRAMWALEEITGKLYGADVSLWEKWLNENSALKKP
jgi:HEAT repeat protein